MHKKKLIICMTLMVLVTSPTTINAAVGENTQGAMVEETVVERNEKGAYLPIEEDDMAPVVEDSTADEERMVFGTEGVIPAVFNPLENDMGYQLPEIRDQNPYGSCWAFTTNAAQEISLLKAGYGMMDLSELQLAYFTYHSVTDPLGGTKGDKVTYSGITNYLDKGGNFSYATASLMNWVGAADESTVPYSDAVKSLINGLDDSLAYDADVAHLQNVYQINIKENPDEVKKMIKGYGAAAITYCDKENSDVYKVENCAYYNPEDETVNHAVTIVGWDDNFSRSNFSQDPKKDGAWLVRNSWGGNGMEKTGYFWLSYEDASISNTAYIMIAEEASNYDHNYIYDGSIASSGWGGDDTVTGANVYTISSGSKLESLEAVSFYAYQSVDADYTIDIYVNPTDDSNPQSGLKITSATTSGKTRYAGYYTIPLGERVLLKQGDKVSVVVTLSKKDGQVWLGKEYDSATNSIHAKASAKPGQSFYQYPSGEWIDFGIDNKSNFRINAYTKDCDDVEAYTVTLDANGGTIAQTTRIVIKDEVYGDLGTPTNGSLEFAGWYTKKDGGTKINVSDVYTLSGDQTLYAHWKGWDRDGDQVLGVYDENGKPIKNQFVCDGTYTYYIQNDGTPMKNRLTYHPNGKDIIYFDEKGHEVFDNFANVKKSISGQKVDDICYFDTFGFLYVDRTTYDRAGMTLYYLNPYGVMQRNGWFQFSNGEVGCAREDGSLVTDQFAYDQWGRLVYLKGDGTVAKGVITDGVFYYRMDENDGHCLEIYQ
ncbi:MAG: lectin like domain-containing protein [Lachnospiraceae bacterium]|nr:lectin like domain-containing protein [Lachnospiraceae bacterium]